VLIGFLCLGPGRESDSGMRRVMFRNRIRKFTERNVRPEIRSPSDNHVQAARVRPTIPLIRSMT
jgi:hypothetical protein